MPPIRLYMILLAATILLVATATFYPTGLAAASWSDQSQSADSADAGTVVTFSALLKDSDGLKNASLNVSFGNGWAINDTQSLSGTQSVAIFRYTVPDYEPGTKVSWNVVFFDATGSKARTDTINLLVSDTLPPQIFDQKQGEDEMTYGEANLLSVRISENYRMSYVAFFTNETKTFKEVRRYNVTDRDSIVSMSWSNPSIKNATVIAWKAVANDSWGNSKTSDVMTFRLHGCPVCPAASEWSDCTLKAGKPQQSQIYYDCNANTDFECVLRTKTQTCVPGTTREEANGAIENAKQLITLAKSVNKDVSLAENLTAQAQAALESGNWELAKAKALEAKTAAEAAQVIKPPSPNYLPVVASVIMAVVAAWMLLRFGKMPKLNLAFLSRKKEKTTEEKKTEKASLATKSPAATSTSNGKRCAICGKTLDKLYTCEECGRKVCYEDARTWNGKIYCTDDLKKKGLM